MGKNDGRIEQQKASIHPGHGDHAPKVQRRKGATQEVVKHIPIHTKGRGYCYVTVGMFARRGLSSKAITLRILSGV